MTPLLAQRHRSDRAFERMYRRHVGDVYRYALAVMRNPADAEDVTQTTFLNAYRSYVEDETPSGEDIRRALSHLAFNQRAALVMRELEGRSYAEIAEILDVSTSAVETLIFRARRALREQLEGSLTCGEAAFARRQRAQRGALKSLALVPVPGSLGSFFGGRGGAAVGSGSAAVGSGIA